MRVRVTTTKTKDTSFIILELKGIEIGKGEKRRDLGKTLFWKEYYR